MPRRTRYQQGSVQREKRHSGPDVWIYRWYETGTDGTSKYRKAIVGTVATLANETSALKAAQALRIDANQQTPHAEGGPKTIAELVAHYRLKELVGENQGTQGVLDASRIRMLPEGLDSSSLGRSQTRSGQVSRS